ncbi:MAG: hypothetical protein JSW10_09070 [Pseudomonadota bacterium]|nr:MAG: hypothetical protein JSW10_09070 [Pseudomonadota bacterium]
MTRDKAVIFTLTLAVCLAGSGLGAEQEHETHHVTHPAAGAMQLQLAPALRDALRAEMHEVQGAMMQLVPAIASGNWQEVANLARKIEGSYLLKEKLSDKQLNALHEALPADFQRLDHEFHALAGMLAHVTHAPHVELVSFYYYKLTDGCVTCHSRYARERFPAFTLESGHHEQNH